MSLDLQATARNGGSSVQRLSSRFNAGKTVKTGLDHAHEPLRLVAFKKQPSVMFPRNGALPQRNVPVQNFRSPTE